ncbi:phosphate/phosphite/phosphonate ABC transporter substrate-binding protein [Mycobacterium montefiorense]|uniref:Phosphate-import protein PhnD n=1 Tax=Mycobacterium montefiorense TaxID=154654 RepID=A0AA37PNG2_9MYCO|nr:phosphate/phosphite/phosphonate ABC transporter substrate-binding protein [Mycobacterium montefiorense]GBG37642.1 phosphate-import protein PhnD [Mycobacterium montefiorense]GKU34779.1 phosphate-import protein PhnD [Mycobacterium montefiorense]GKU40793.1 phosphate-import protein PhnD [Mycobacterium montefiorense]GKU46900.1 phosphate-import protein PhnD [Mycobacterium montefiorense]GKU49020.1 phosphate-import protein PhnD [Mycobacterium montefiorense]
MLARPRGSLGLAAIAVLATVLLAACGQSASAGRSGGGPGGRNPGELVFAAVPSENAQSLQQAYQPLITLLQKATGKTIRFQSATSYSSAIEAQRADKADFVQYGPFSLVTAQNSGVKVTPIAAETVAKGTPPGYHSYGITRPGTGINSIADFRGKKICFVDLNSTSGYLYPSSALINAGIDPNKDVTQVISGGHDASALSVLNGQCDAGFAQESMIDTTLPGKGQLKPGQLNVVWKSDLIRGSPIGISDDLAPDLKSKIINAFGNANVDYMNANGICTPACAHLGEVNGWGYATVDNSFYDSVRKVCQTTHAKQCAGQQS